MGTWWPLTTWGRLIKTPVGARHRGYQGLGLPNAQRHITLSPWPLTHMCLAMCEDREASEGGRRNSQCGAFQRQEDPVTASALPGRTCLCWERASASRSPRRRNRPLVGFLKGLQVCFSKVPSNIVALKIIFLNPYCLTFQCVVIKKLALPLTKEKFTVALRFGVLQSCPSETGEWGVRSFCVSPQPLNSPDTLRPGRGRPGRGGTPRRAPLHCDLPDPPSQSGDSWLCIAWILAF